MTATRDHGTVIYDISPMLSAQPFVANGRLYVSPLCHYTVATTKKERDLYVMPFWSKEDNDEMITLELIIVKEVVPESERGIAGGDAFVRSLVVVGRSSEEDPKEINVLEIPQMFKELLDDLFPTGSSLSEESGMAYAILNEYTQRVPFVIRKRNGQNSSDSKEESESLRAPAADGVRSRSRKKRQRSETEPLEEKDEKAAMDSEHGDEDDSQEHENETKENRGETELPTGKREGHQSKREDDE